MVSLERGEEIEMEKEREDVLAERALERFVEDVGHLRRRREGGRKYQSTRGRERE